MSERLEDIIQARKQKLENLKKLGIDPYPASTARNKTISEITNDFEFFLQGETQSGEKIVPTIAGRVRSWRNMGKIVFAHIEDGTGRMQVLFKEDTLGKEQFEILVNNVDIGDFIEATGTAMQTKTGEKTLAAASFSMLAKSLLPLPGEHYGLSDEEIKLRKRYLDILMDPAAKQLFVNKNKFWQSMRQFLVDNGFLEMEMPVLEAVPGGAEAEPFVTHHNALDRDFYLRISLELPLKKMLVAGYEKVFEIGRIFRNEGIDTEHLQDYTQMEFYWAYASFDDMMEFVQNMYQHVIQSTFGSLQTSFQGQSIDWSGSWPRQDYFALFKQHTGLDLNTTTSEELASYADENHIKYEPGAGKGRLIDLIFKKKIRVLREVSMQPSFLVNQPVELEPLAKRDPKNPNVVQRMQILACGSELGKGFGELNDPLDQRQRFEDQMKLRAAGDTEAQMLDEGYVEAMEYGMPPAAGFGVSERLFAVLNDKSVRETVIFPPMKSEK